MTLPLFEPTYTVSQLGGEIRDFLRESFDSFWVTGEVQRARPSRSGHFYFELVEKGEGDQILGKLDAVLWRLDYDRVRRLLAQHGQEIADGLEMRCRAGVDFYPPGGRLQLVVREVDPVFSLGVLARRRRETLEALATAGLLERQRGLVLTDLPLRIALVTSEGSAAYHDFLATLRESGYGFQVLFVHAAVQGREAEREVVTALAALSGLNVDAIALVRGGGARAELAVFDSRAIAEAVARAPYPVMTGLGHEIDEAVSDLVAHAKHKTPTKVAEFLVQRVRAAEERLERARQKLRREAEEPLREAGRRVEAAERGVHLAALELRAAGERLAERARRLAYVARGRIGLADAQRSDLRRRLALGGVRRVERRRQEPQLVARRVAEAARARLREQVLGLAGRARLVESFAPRRTLRRGFSITRTASGAVLRAPREVRGGDVLKTEVAGGELRSRVEEA